jgi:hypothetical protein
VNFKAAVGYGGELMSSSNRYLRENESPVPTERKAWNKGGNGRIELGSEPLLSDLKIHVLPDRRLLTIDTQLQRSDRKRR